MMQASGREPFSDPTRPLQGRLRGKDLADSLKLSRDRMTSQAQSIETGRLSRQESSWYESKFAEASDEEDSHEGGQSVQGENIPAKSNVGASLQGGGKSSRTGALLEYLDNAGKAAEGEREFALRKLDMNSNTARRRRRRFEWEEADEDEEGECESHFGSERSSQPPRAPTHVGASPGIEYDSQSPSIRSDLGAMGPSGSLSGRSSVSSGSRRLVALKLEVEEKTKTIAALKRALTKARSEKSQASDSASRQIQQGLEQQRVEHEKAVARHLGFIDKLLADKKHLAGKVEELASRIKRSDESFAKRLRDEEETHAKNLAKLRETLTAQDAAKRAKWQKEKSKELKELTIKGLEPEIQSILAKHKEDIVVLEDRFKDEARALKASNQKELERATQELRHRHEVDLEEMRSKERSSLAAKLRQQETRHTEEMKKQRERLELEFEDIRKRHKEEMLEAQARLESRVNETARAKELDLIEQKRRLELQLDTLEQKWAVEKEQWQAKVIRKLEDRARTEEQQLRANLTAARDKQIDAVLGKLYAEQESKIREINEQHEATMREAQKRFEQRLGDMEASLRDSEAKCSKLRDAHRAEKKTMSSAERRVRELEAQAEKREARIVELCREVSSVNDRLAEREQDVRAEYAERGSSHVQEISRLQEQVGSVREELAKANLAHKQDIAALKLSFGEETEEIHRRVHVTISRKDDTIQALRVQLQDLQEKYDSYVELMDRQRDAFVGLDSED